MEKGIIVGVNTNQTNNEKFIEELEELKNLCFACNIEIVDQVTQNRDYIDNRTYVGKGKIDEIKLCIQSLDVECVVFNDELLPSQISNLEKLLEITIYDRTFIILELSPYGVSVIIIPSYLFIILHHFYFKPLYFK